MSQSIGEKAFQKAVEKRPHVVASYRRLLGFQVRIGHRPERARLDTNGCILSGPGTPKSEFRLKRLLRFTLHQDPFLAQTGEDNDEY